VDFRGRCASGNSRGVVDSGAEVSIGRQRMLIVALNKKKKNLFFF